MLFQWTDDLYTGNDHIDNQHKEIFRHINTLLEACQAGKGKERLAETIDFLEKYVITHFTAEERLQHENAYPGYTEHKAEHAKFMKEITSLKTQLKSEGASLPLIVTTNRVVVGWLVNHIKKDDRAMAKYLQQYS